MGRDSKHQEQAQIKPTFSSSDETYDKEKGDEDESVVHYSCYQNSSVIETPFLFLSEQDLFCEDDELTMLLSKEKNQEITREPDLFVSCARREAVEWILQATAHHSFSPLTALLAVNYIDRFMLEFDDFRTQQKRWMAELTAIACLSLSAKVDEIHVPLLLDLQVEGTSEFMFEAKTIQRMEILVLSTLQWRMNPVTSLSFIHYISKRFRLKGRTGIEFLRRCELTLLSLVSDHRFTSHLPSVMAAAVALHVVNSVAVPTVALEYKKLVMGILSIDKDKLEQCQQFVRESALLRSHSRSRCKKRKFAGAPGSPKGVMDASFSSDGSSHSWTTASYSPSSSVTSSPEPKKTKNEATKTTTTTR